MTIEQAIFTSASTRRADGYQIVGISSGVTNDDQREIALWGPSHDSLISPDSEVGSVNFFQLPSGAYCVSKSAPAGEEYSLRKGARVYTHFLVFANDTFARFGSNPFAVLMAAVAAGKMEVRDEPWRLSSFELRGRATAVDLSPLRPLTSADSELLARAIDQLVEGHKVAVVGASDGRMFVEALLSVLPPSCRADVSFSTGLKFSARRPFRLMTLDEASSEERRRLQRAGVVVIETPRACQPRGGVRTWGTLAARMAVHPRLSDFASALRQAPAECEMWQLTRMAERLWPTLVEGTPETDDGAMSGDGSKARAVREQWRADGSHRGKPEAETVAVAAAPDLATDPVDVLGAERPDAVDLLQRLDDTVFEAVAGKPGAADQLRTLWPQAMETLGPALVERCREQYLRHAVKVWRECSNFEDENQTLLTLAATEVIELLSRDFTRP